MFDLLYWSKELSHYLFVETDTTNVQTNISGPRYALVNNSVVFSVSINISVTKYKDIHIVLE